MSMKPSQNDKTGITTESPSYRRRSKHHLQLNQVKEQPQRHQIGSNIDSQHLAEQSESALKVKREAQQAPRNEDYQLTARNEVQVKKEHACANHQLRSKEERKRAILKLSKRRSSKRSSECDGGVKIQQGTRLIKDQNGPIDPYYCEKCFKTLLTVEEYVTHCTEDCGTIIHEDSSITISLDFKQEAKMEPIVSHSFSVVKDQISIKHQSFPPSNEYDQVSDNQPIKQIFALKLDHRSYRFFCGQCGYNSENPNGYFRHIATSHSSKVHPASSHVILRCFQSRSCLLYISLHDSWIHEQRKYSCPCNTQQRFSMTELLQHLMAIHSGISPVYYLSLTPFIRRQPALSKQLEMLQHIRDIIFNCQNHKEFSCGKCGKTYKMAGGYKNHMEKMHGGDFGRQSSHVILRTEYRYDIYLSPKIKWHHEDAIYFCPCSGVDFLMSMERLIQHVIEQHRGMSPLYQTSKLSSWRITQRYQPINRIYKQQDQSSKWQDPMYLLLIQGYQDHRDLQFRCPPCEFETKHPKKYSNHMENVHNSCIPPDSSHIIFQFAEDFSHRKRKLYVCPTVYWKVNQHQNYYCPCLPREKMRMERLIEHVLQVHSGVSPKYQLQKYDASGTIFAKVETVKKQQPANYTEPEVKWKGQDQGLTMQFQDL